MTSFQTIADEYSDFSKMVIKNEALWTCVGLFGVKSSAALKRKDYAKSLIASMKEIEPVAPQIRASIFLIIVGKFEYCTKEMFKECCHVIEGKHVSYASL